MGYQDISGKTEYIHRETLTDGETSDWMIVHPVKNKSGNISCYITPTSSGIGKIEITLDPISKVKDGTARPSEWPLGEITSSSDSYIDIASQIVALRGVSVSGENIFGLVI